MPGKRAGTKAAALLATGAVVIASALWGCSSDSSSVIGSGGSAGDDSSAETTSSATSGSGGAGSTTTTAETTTATTSTGAGGAPPCPGLGDACTECLAHKCSDVYCGCSENASCGSLLSCLTGCGAGNQDCQNNCFASNGDGISDAALIGDCSASICPTDCTGGTALTACQQCLFTSCESQMNKCFSDSDCSALVACAAECAPDDSGCFQSCGLQHLGAISDAQAVGDCQKSACGAPCAQ